MNRRYRASRDLRLGVLAAKQPVAPSAPMPLRLILVSLDKPIDRSGDRPAVAITKRGLNSKGPDSLHGDLLGCSTQNDRKHQMFRTDICLRRKRPAQAARNDPPSRLAAPALHWVTLSHDCSPEPVSRKSTRSQNEKSGVQCAILARMSEACRNRRANRVHFLRICRSACDVNDVCYP